MEWAELNADTLPGWMNGFRHQVKPVAFRLDEPAEVRLPNLERLAPPFPFNTVIRRDSGTLELVFTPPTLSGLYTGDLDRIASFGSAIASELDRRSLHTIWQQSDAGMAHSAVIYESESRISDNEQTVDVIGPGGRFTVYLWGDRLSADLTVRRRQTAGIPTGWIDFIDIAERVRAELQEAGKGARLQAAFGYFEASKYEFQQWLTLAFVFAIERAAKPENGPRFSMSLVEPAIFEGN